MLSSRRRAASRSRMMNRIRLKLHAKHQMAGVFEKVEEILAQKNLAAAEREDEDAGLGHLVEEVLDLGGGHLAMVVMIEIAVHASFVAAIRQDRAGR